MNIQKKEEWGDTEDQVVEDFCKEDCAEYESFHDHFAAIDEFKIKKVPEHIEIFSRSSSGRL